MTCSKNAVSARNPFLIEMIVERLFLHVEPEELLNCLEVCESWKQLALRELYNRTESLTTLYKEHIKGAANSIETGDVPPARFSRVILFGVRIYSCEAKIFLAQTGNYITRLVLYSCVAKPSDFRKILCDLCNLTDLGIISLSSEYEIVKPYKLFPILGSEAGEFLDFPKLRRLHYQSICTVLDPSDRDTTSKPAITYLSDVFQTFPNLDHISVMNLAFEDPSNFKRCQPYSVKKLSLKVSVLFEGLSDRILEMLCNMKLSLEHLDIKINPSVEVCLPIPFYTEPLDVNTDLVRKFVESQASTLKSLEIFQVNEAKFTVARPSFCPFPLNLPNLKLLEIHGAFVRNLSQVLNPLPALAEARFWFLKDTDWSESIIPNLLQQHRELRTLRIQHIDADSLEMLLKCFENVTTLQISHCNLEVLRYLGGNYFPEFQKEVSQEFGRGCDDCKAREVPLMHDQISFRNQESVKMTVVKSKSSDLPDLKRIFLRCCRHRHFYCHLLEDEPKLEKPYLTPTEILDLNMFERHSGVAVRSQLWMREPEPGSNDLEYRLGKLGD